MELRIFASRRPPFRAPPVPPARAAEASRRPAHGRAIAEPARSPVHGRWAEPEVDRRLHRCLDGRRLA